jgi:hypothetical protein
MPRNNCHTPAGKPPGIFAHIKAYQKYRVACPGWSLFVVVLRLVIGVFYANPTPISTI